MRKRVGLPAVILFLASVLAVPASADTIYTYTGNPFTGFFGTYACPPVCQISGWFTVAQPIPTNFSGLVAPTSFSFTDGSTIMDNSNAQFGFGLPQIMTDGTGNITGWWIQVNIGNSLLVTGAGILGTFDLTSSNLGSCTPPLDCAVTATPGQWAFATSPVPEPSSLFLFATGLAGLWLRRRMG